MDIQNHHDEDIFVWKSIPTASAEASINFYNFLLVYNLHTDPGGIYSLYIKVYSHDINIIMSSSLHNKYSKSILHILSHKQLKVEYE